MNAPGSGIQEAEYSKLKAVMLSVIRELLSVTCLL